MSVSATASIAAVTTAETAIVSVEPMASVGNAVRLSGCLYFTGNSVASTLVITIRRGTGTAGTAIFTSSAITVAASAAKIEPFDWVDSSPGVTETYTVTATFSGAPTGAVEGSLTAQTSTSIP